MEITTLPNDIQLLCKLVPEFPLGIKEGFEELFKRFGQEGRTNYAISYMEGNRIIYKVGITGSVDDIGNEEYEPFILPKGKYITESLTDWMDNIYRIKESFGKLMQHPDFDNTFPCVEWYQDNKKMLCMVKSKD
jgi:hypothetical protein